MKEIQLQRSDSFGFGFSIIGGSGSELPPVICDIVEDSPADHCDEVGTFTHRKKILTDSACVVSRLTMPVFAASAVETGKRGQRQAAKRRR